MSHDHFRSVRDRLGSGSRGRRGRRGGGRGRSTPHLATAKQAARAAPIDTETLSRGIRGSLLIATTPEPARRRGGP